MPTNQNPKMEEDFFRYLPVDIIIEILSRLPILTIINCKMGHKEWLNLVNSPEFAQLHLSKSLSAPGLAVFELEEGMSSDSEPYTVFEIADELSHEESGSYFDTVFDFTFLDDEYIHSSVNDYEIVIWLMKEYGDEKSWSEEVIIDIDPHSEIDAYFPVEVFKDGDILIVGVEEQNTELRRYSDMTVAIPEPIRYGLCSGDHTSIVTYTPSFIPAKCFQM